MAGTRSVHGTRLCRLDESAAGRMRPCTEARCPFWEPGGAALEGRCAFETVDFERRPGLAARLVKIRTQLETARTEEEEREAHDLFLRALAESAGR